MSTSILRLKTVTPLFIIRVSWREQREAFPDKDHALTISSDLPCEDGVPPCRPSSEINEESEVLYFDNDKSAITHEWDTDDECWYPI